MRCPAGHESASSDYCDVCGEPMAAGSADSGMPPAPVGGTAAGSAGGGSVGAPNPLDPGNPLDPPNPLDPVPPEPGDPTGAPAGTVPEAPPPSVPDPGGEVCPNCGAVSSPDALFCETCGYDFTTGTMPRRVPTGGEATAAGGIPANVSPDLDPPWVAEIWIDPAWYDSQSSPDALPSAGPPVVVPLHHRSLLIGRTSTSRDIHPDIECGADNGVSRRHAELTTDGTRWWIEDLQSSNGTYIGDAVGGIPTEAIRPGTKREVDADDRIYVGSWTRIVLRPAMEGEV